MSSKTDNLDAVGPAAHNRSWSLGARLTLWYGASAFTLVLIACLILYWGLVQALQAEDDETLQERVQVVRSLLLDSSQGQTLEWEIQAESLSVDAPLIFIRVSDDRGRALIETPGMDSLLPQGLLQDTFVDGASEGMAIRGPSGKTFRATRDRLERASDGSARIIDVAVDFTSDERVLSRYRDLLAVVLAASALLCWGVGYRIARQGISPVREVVHAARRIRMQTLGERIQLDHPPAEVAELVENFNLMLARLEDSFDRLSTFSADLSHELRTPLSNLRGETEVALGQARTADEYREILASNLEEYSRLSRIVDNLLFIARAEDTEAEVHKEPLEVSTEMRSLVDFYEPLASEQGVSISLSCPENLEVNLDRALLNRAVGNLLANAIAHTPSGGLVDLIVGEDSGAIRVQVQDTGCGIAEEHLPHIFERFYRVDQTRDRSSGGTGLGLSIVKSAVQMQGGTISVANRLPRGTNATISFPAVRCS